MAEKEIILLIILSNLIVLLFLIGIGIFVFQYRKRKLAYEKELSRVDQEHYTQLLKLELNTRQETMQYIGSEIHDSVNQKLTLASIYSQKLEFENSGQSSISGQAHITDLINDTLEELRQLSRSLNDGAQQYSIVELIAREVERVNSFELTEIDFSYNVIPILQLREKNFLLRICQEFIQNSLKHSACTEIRITLSEVKTNFVLVLADNGIGFDVTKSEMIGMGLSNITRRVSQIQGIFAIQSNSSIGTQMEIKLPKPNVK